jgi:hypothetical protein
MSGQFLGITYNIVRAKVQRALFCIACPLLHPQDVDDINQEVKKAIQTAEETCNGGDAAHCAAA